MVIPTLLSNGVVAATVTYLFQHLFFRLDIQVVFSFMGYESVRIMIIRLRILGHGYVVFGAM
ncbi:unnamed protein product [Arabis nemorensis]|uniref:Uncharacterized protein n=1 Tax=Arabis nemorensis TaxID=586526 RepID=A0A565BG83_9BRAS|nr:unnamed protein product [Arabis nemorensis]